MGKKPWLVLKAQLMTQKPQSEADLETSGILTVLQLSLSFCFNFQKLVTSNDKNGLASSSVKSLDHDTLPAKLAPGPLHLYCP